MVPPGLFPGTGMPDAEWWEALWPDPAQVLRQVGMPAGKTVIDLCCGDGWFTRQIACRARLVLAIDLDERLLEIARERLAKAGLSNCRFIRGDAYDVAQLAPKPADFVFLANVFHGVPEKPRLARAVHAALKPRGIFAIVNWYAWPRDTTRVLGEARGPASELRMSPAALGAVVEPNGFALERLTPVSPYHYGATFRRAPELDA